MEIPGEEGKLFPEYTRGTSRYQDKASIFRAQGILDIHCDKKLKVGKTYTEENPQHAYTTFYLTFYNLYDKSIPQVNHTNSYHKANQTPWITKGILRSRTIKNKLYKKIYGRTN